MKKSPIPFWNTKTSYIYDKSPTMKWIKLTAFTVILFSFMLSLTSCEKEAEKKKTTDYSRLSIAMTGAQETPATTSTAIGSMDVFYSKKTHTLIYTVIWTGLTGAVTGMHIHGLDPIGYSHPSNIVQNIIASSGGIATPNATLYGASGKFSGTLYVDGVVVKEENLLNGLYYMNIHTTLNGNGEIRGQIVFQ
jgi:hypothetical protein